MAKGATVFASLLLAQAEEGNEAFLGIGVIGWIIIIAIVVAVWYFLRRRPR
jgi:predicted ABC-type sugar transport system permease subunit